MFDYETMRLIWWALTGILLIGFALTDGFDMGVGALLRIIGKTDIERRVLINSIAPHWDGNQVWLVTFGGALFATWPLVYATAFSGFYMAMMITLMALFLRPVGFDYRSKLDNHQWRNLWDWGLVIGSSVPPIIFGVAFGNLFLGVPFTLDEMLRPSYHGSFIDLLNPFGLLAGVISLMMILTHGCAWLMLKTTENLWERARFICLFTALATGVLFALAGLWITNGFEGYVLNEFAGTQAPSNPLVKDVSRVSGVWLDNFQAQPLLWLAPISGVLMPFLTTVLVYFKRCAWAFLTSSLTLVGIILTAGFALFPFILPSSLEPNHSLTLWDASASLTTMRVTFSVAIVFVPLILGYTIWCYVKMFGRISPQYIQDNAKSLY